MERPISVASSRSSVHRSRPGSSHIKPPTQHVLARTPPTVLQNVSTASLFVTNLRLLDFDLLPDWPGITAETFGIQDGRARIRGTEFALFQLFRFYDPMLTSEKLQPFFPPLEPLQSINLRAALFRCLNELKKNGVLGKETVLRKSMLDECQGEKFLELCLSFSATVVRKITLARQEKHVRSEAEHIGLARHIFGTQLDSMLPLAIAHKSALGKILRQKQERHEKYLGLYNTLIQKEAELQQRKAHVQEQTRKRPYMTGLENVAEISKKLDRGLKGHDVLQRLLIKGDHASSKDTILTKPFDQVWAANHQDSMSGLCHDLSMIEHIQRRADKQAERLRKWQATHDKLKSRIALQSKSTSQSASGANLPKFDSHRKLTVRDAPVLSAPPLSQRQDPKVAQYDEILTAMREDLRRTRQRTGSATIPSMHRTKTNSVGSDDKPIATYGDRTSAEQDRGTFPPVRSTTVPLRPNMFNRRVSSRSKSYQQPRVISMRQPRPLMSGSTSTEKEPSTSATPTALSPSEDGPSIDGMTGSEYTNVSNAEIERPISLGSDAMGTIDSGIGLQSDTDKDEDQNRDNISSLANLTKSHATNAAKRLSLADRTRASMELSSAQQSKTPMLVDDATLVASPVDDKECENGSVESPPAPMSLMERTRQSILLAPKVNLPSPSSTSAPSKEHSPAVNPFLTPIRVSKTRKAFADGSIEHEDEEDNGVSLSIAAINRNVTPRENLFSPDADYASVFRSRPKIGLESSPEANKRPDSGRVSIEFQDIMRTD